MGAQAYADFADVAKLALEPHIPAPDRYIIEGPSLTVGSRQAVSLALALHELATNATKYGAMSGPSGRVLVTWSVSAAAPRQLRFEWREEGGPPVVPPAHKGFGSRLVKTVMANDFGGIVTMNYAPAGLVVSLLAPANTPELSRAAENETDDSELGVQNTGT